MKEIAILINTFHATDIIKKNVANMFTILPQKPRWLLDKCSPPNTFWTNVLLKLWA